MRLLGKERKGEERRGEERRGEESKGLQRGRKELRKHKEREMG